MYRLPTVHSVIDRLTDRPTERQTGDITPMPLSRSYCVQYDRLINATHSGAVVTSDL